jgi:phosphopantetheinyl transferase (holo-ACP synthase)
MSKPTVRIHDMETGEVLDRVMTDAEHTAWQAQQVEAEAAAEAQAAQAAAKEALLDRLGITADEARMLIQ